MYQPLFAITARSLRFIDPTTFSTYFGLTCFHASISAAPMRSMTTSSPPFHFSTSGYSSYSFCFSSIQYTDQMDLGTLFQSRSVEKRMRHPSRYNKPQVTQPETGAENVMTGLRSLTRTAFTRGEINLFSKTSASFPVLHLESCHLWQLLVRHVVPKGELGLQRSPRSNKKRVQPATRSELPTS